jgi:hypothetical protein
MTGSLLKALLQALVAARFRLLPSSDEPGRAGAVLYYLGEAHRLLGNPLSIHLGHKQLNGGVGTLATRPDTRTEEHFRHQEKAIEFYRKEVQCVHRVCALTLFSVIP